MKKETLFSYVNFTLSVCFIVSMLPACAHDPQKGSSQVPVDLTLDGPVNLILKSNPGQTEVVVNCSQSITEAFEDKNILRKRIEELDFKVKTTTKAVLKNGNIIQDVETIQRDGPGSLHDLAYPEVGEVLDMELTPAGQVVKAGKYAQDSLFYLPSIPLPNHPVKQGEEWTSINSWKSDVAGPILKAELHLKIIDKKRCGDHSCVNIGVTGKVIFPEVQGKSKFTHLITGRFLFDLEKGFVPWSEFGSEEQVLAQNGTMSAKVLVHGKLRSELSQPLGYRTISHEEPACPFENKAE